MKFLCTHCSRLVEVERFAVDGSSLVVTCTQCGEENRATSSAASSPAAPVPAPTAAQRGIVALRTPTVEAIARAAASVNEKPFDVPMGHCPKCISRRMPEALACPSCGLSFSTATGNAFAPSEWLQAQWLDLLGSWGEDLKHEAVRAEALNRNELAPLGRLYRLRVAAFPADPYAARGREEVLRLAVLPQVTVRQLKVDPQQRTWKYVALSFVILGSLMALFFLVRRLLALA